MHAASRSESRPARRSPRRLTVFVAAFVAGAAAAVGVNQALDVHLAQKRPQVECEPIFVALRSLAQGAPVTVWDVALRDWPKAMLPTTAMRAEDSFEGCVLRHPLREGQPLLKVQLVRDAGQSRTEPLEGAAFVPPAPVAPAAEADLWTPAPAAPVASTTPLAPATVPAATPRPSTSADVAPPIAAATPADPADAAADAAPSAAATDAPSTAPAGEPVPVAVAGDPPPVAAVDEPTLAEPQPDEPTLADTPPPFDAGVESVVVARSVTTNPAPAVPAPVAAPSEAGDAGRSVADAAPRSTTSRDGIVRYLVVPERVALQADAGFGTPAPAPGAAAATGTRDPAPVRQAPVSRNRSAQAGQQRPGQPVAQPKSRSQMTPQATRTRSQPAPSRAQATQPRRQATPPVTRPPTAATPRGLGGMFPNIAAGIEAMTGRKPRTADEGFDQAVATDDPAPQTR